MESTYLGAYWGGRRESAREAGERLAGCVAVLLQADPVLGRWFRLGSSKAAAAAPVGVDAASLEELFDKGRSHRDSDGLVIEDLGFSLGLWNRARPAVSLGAHVGAHPIAQGIVNSFVLQFPPPDEDAAHLYQHDVAGMIFRAVVDAWAPDNATWTTHRLRDSQSPAPGEPIVGWQTYLRDPAPSMTLLSMGEPTPAGVIIWAAAEFTDVEVESVLEIRERLRRTSALRPIP